MTVPSERAQRWAQSYRLSVTTPRGQIGDQLGRGTGGSLEFEERREYEPGDDVRRIDWPAVARTDQIYTRLYREEISPRVELLLDDSRSLGHDEEKATWAVDMGFALAAAARAAGNQLRILALGDEPQRLDLEQLESHGLAFVGKRPLDDALRVAGSHLGRGSVRIVVSDFLVPARPEQWLRRLAEGAGRLVLIQLYGQSDLEPAAAGAQRLVDSETGAELELRLDPATLAEYERRRQRLEADLAQEARRSRAIWVSLRPGDGEEKWLQELTRHGVWSLR